MRKLLCGLMACLILASCQKEVTGDFGGGSTPGGSGSGLLKSLVTHSGADSTSERITYDGAGHFITFDRSGSTGGMGYSTSLRYVRNSNGIITQEITKDTSYASLGIDSIITYVRYDAAAGRYTSRLTAVNFFGFFIYDSAALIYDAAGKVKEMTDYADYGLGYELSAKETYVYNGNNIAEVHIFQPDQNTGLMTDVGQGFYTFDNKPGATAFGKDANAMANPVATSVNNVTNFRLVVPSDPTQNQTLNYSYTFNSAGKPATATVTGSQSATAVYTYY